MKKYLLLSCLSHALIFISALIVFHFQTSVKTESLPNINTYFVNKNHLNKTIIKPNGILKSEKKTKKISKSINTLSPNKTETHNELLKLLHQAIAAKQQYPEAAINLHQEGTVKIGMYIKPDGKITQLSILQTSGFNTIDLAALSAIQAISPFFPAKNFLQTTEYFSVDVLFSL